MSTDILKIMVSREEDGCYVATIKLDDDGLFLAAHRPTQHGAITTVSKAFSAWPGHSPSPQVNVTVNNPSIRERADARTPEDIRALIETAADAGGTVSIEYTDADDVTTVREVDVETYGNKLFGGHDYLRNEFRQFRFDRVKNAVRV